MKKIFLLLSLFYCASVAFAQTQPQLQPQSDSDMLGSNNEELQAILAKKGQGDVLLPAERTMLSSFEKDKKKYDKNQKDSQPVCKISDGAVATAGSMPDCANLTPEQLKSAPYVTELDATQKQKYRFVVSKERRIEIELTNKMLRDKWSGSKADAQKNASPEDSSSQSAGAAVAAALQQSETDLAFITILGIPKLNALVAKQKSGAVLTKEELQTLAVAKADNMFLQQVASRRPVCMVYQSGQAPNPQVPDCNTLTPKDLSRTYEVELPMQMLTGVVGGGALKVRHLGTQKQGDALAIKVLSIFKKWQDWGAKP